MDVQKPSRAVGHQFGVKHRSCGRERPEDITDLAREAKRNALIRAQWNYLTHNVNVRFGESPRDQRSLKFFLAETAPTIGNYGPCNMFWTRLVPQLAFEFPVIRHLLVAMALLDEQLGVSETTKIKPASLALWHYQMALRGMAMVERADEPFLVLASSMGWVFESLQGNFSASAIHLRASARLLKELESGSSDPLASDMVAAVKPMVNLSMSFSSIVHGASSPIDTLLGPDDGDCDDQPTEPWAVSIDSLAQARDMLIERLTRFKRADVPSRYTALALRRYIVSWRKRARIHCLPSKESSLHKQTMQILFIMALSFLPEDIAGPFSTANEAASRHLLDTIERLAVAKRETASWDEADIDVTLSVALAFLAEHLPDLYSRKRAGHLLASFPRAPRAKTNDTRSSTSGLLWNRFRPGKVTFEGDGDGDGEEGEIASGLGLSAIEKQYSRVFD
ncbi:hypothetical protein PV08_07606 [Exophiala spinifera]|uniref:Transcription factor domain-containing protein n=1 Tax=Exophiala spinifera TaxID=91928 RepID=A0A0D1YIQ7_9EURO|nr:uncharacterized protein PV08_07606 [Exophiala spinifera]KIW14821.1 hypothetical protein PV08_07606 [Exophiala spinifera]